MPTKTAAATPARATYTEEQKTAALAAYAEHGPAETERRTGIPRRTIASWARRTGTQSDAPAKMAAAVEAAALTLEQRKQALAGRLLTEVGQLLDQLHKPVTRKEIVKLPGKILVQIDDEGDPEFASGWTVAQVELAEPTVADQKTIMVTAAIAVDKVQVLTGGATHRVAFEGEADQEVRSVAAEILHVVTAKAS